MAGRLKDEIGKRGPFESLQQEVFLNLQRTADALARGFDELFKPLELSPTQYNVLRILRGAGGEGLACREVAGRMVTRDPDMTRLLDRLEKRGLITRDRQQADRRVVKVRITRDGLALIAKLDQPLRLMHARQFEHMTQQQLRELLKLLEESRSKPARRGRD